MGRGCLLATAADFWMNTRNRRGAYEKVYGVKAWNWTFPPQIIIKKQNKQKKTSGRFQWVKIIKLLFPWKSLDSEKATKGPFWQLRYLKLFKTSCSWALIESDDADESFTPTLPKHVNCLAAVFLSILNFGPWNETSNEEEIPLNETVTRHTELLWKFQWLSLKTSTLPLSQMNPVHTVNPLQSLSRYSEREKVSGRRVVFGACWRLRVTTASTSEGVSQPLWQWIKLRTAEYQTPGLTVLVFFRQWPARSL